MKRVEFNTLPYGLILAGFVLGLLALLVVNSTVYAATSDNNQTVEVAVGSNQPTTLSGSNSGLSADNCPQNNLAVMASCAIPTVPGDGSVDLSVTGLLGKVITVLSYIIGVSAVIVLMIQGLRMVTSGGNSDTFNEARDGILYAIVGLVVAVFAPVIINFALRIFGGVS